MASQSTELNEAISKYFIAQYNEMHQKEVIEEKAAIKAHETKLAEIVLKAQEQMKEEMKELANGEEDKDKEVVVDEPVN